MKHIDLHREQTFRKLLDYVRMNGVALSRSGFYAGRAGIALCLFEAARFLHDDRLEEAAIVFLKQALISQTKDISFENGLSGIGYVLDYLIRHGFLEADYDELFGRQTEKVFEEFCNRLPLAGQKYSEGLKLLSIARLIEKRGTKETKEKADSMLNQLFEIINGQWNEVKDKQAPKPSDELMGQFRVLLSTALCMKEYVPDARHLFSFMACYESQRLKYDPIVFHYLKQLSTRMTNSDVDCFLDKHYLSLSPQRTIDCQLNLHDETTLLALEKDNACLSNRFLQQYIDASPNEIELHVERVTPDNELKVGIGFGVARLILMAIMLLSPDKDKQRIATLFMD